MPRIRHRRRAARMAAVQALYAIDVAGENGERRLEDLHPDVAMPTADYGIAEPDVDMVLLRRIVEGVSEQRDEIDAAIAANLSPSWPAERLETLLRAILRGGAFELRAFPNTPVKVVISEYIDVAHCFFSGREPALVNAVLDGIAAEGKAAQINQPTDEG